MKERLDYKFWFCTGSQDLYGDECLSFLQQSISGHHSLISILEQKHGY